MKLLKKRKYQVIIGLIVLVIIIVGASAFFLTSNNSNPQTTQDENVSEDQVQTLSPSQIGLKIEASSDDKKVRFVINDASNIKAIEYELTYNANATADELSEGAQAQVQRGITGQENITSGTGTYTSTWLVLGSQSANMVRYDTGVKGVSITLKITKNDNSVDQVQDSLKF
jgi:apolipoprotein N-acyltransferase